MSFEALHLPEENEKWTEADYGRLPGLIRKLEILANMKETLDEAGGSITERFTLNSYGKIDLNAPSKRSDLDDNIIASALAHDLAPDIIVSRESLMQSFDEAKELDPAWHISYETDPNGKYFTYTLSRES